MDLEQSEKLASSLERSLIKLGADDYEQGMETVLRLLHKLVTFVEMIRTGKDLRSTLSAAQLSSIEKAVVPFVFAHLPQIVRVGTKVFAQKAAASLPAPSGGRPPAVPPSKRNEALD